MTDMITRLRTALTASNWNEIRFQMDNGDTLTISPCGYAPVLNEQNTEYYLISSDKTPNLGGETLEIIARQLANYEQHLQEQAAEKTKLRAYFDRYIATGKYDDEIWSFYSDWHKDVYGYRPHGIVCGVYVNPHKIRA